MSTPRTGSAQLARLLSLGRSVKLLPPLRDIDEPDDAAHVADHFPTWSFRGAMLPFWARLDPT